MSIAKLLTKLYTHHAQENEFQYSWQINAQ